MDFLDRLRLVFSNEDIISAISGVEIQPPFFDQTLKQRTQVYTAFGYVFIFSSFILFSILMPQTPLAESTTELPQLIFTISDGPGGGGGGGDGEEKPLSEQEIEGPEEALVAISIDVPEEELVFDDPDINKIEEEEELVEEEVPEINAPLVAKAPDDIDRLGTIEGLENNTANAGAGTGGGLGEGAGTGLDAGTGGGFGGGAYRMGSGISAPQLTKQVRPIYTEEALKRKVEGVVLLEVIILKEGKVGDVRVLQGLSSGLNQQAIACVRQWLFLPGKFKGKPVDVVGEVAVEFSIL